MTTGQSGGRGEVGTFKDSNGTQWTAVYLTRTQALLVIESLSRQVRTGDPNTGRPEFRVNGKTGKLEYFTVAVLEEKDGCD